MGILTDFVIAKDEDAVAISEATRAADHWPTLESKGVDTIKLSTLYCAATNTEYENAIQASFTMMAGDEEEGPWVFKFPSEILSAIAHIESDSVSSIAKIWAATEELQMDGWSEDDAARFITELVAHAKTTRATGASMFLWMSL